MPLPANVLIMPALFTLRIRLFMLSAMYTLPELSIETPEGLNISAEMAGPPSPLYAAMPLPAIVVMICALVLVAATTSKAITISVCFTMV